MKITIATTASITALTLLFSNVSAYGYVTNVITATNTKSVKQSDISVIYSNGGEGISKIDSLHSAFKISFTDDNYITTKFARVTSSENNENYVPVYASPDVKSVASGAIPVGSIVVVGEQKDNFSQIFFEEKIGYIENIYLADENLKEETPTQPTNKYVKITSSTGLNLRQAPSSTSAILTTIPNGAYADYIQTEGDWLKIKYNDQVGYISKEFAQITDQKEQQTISKGQQIIDFAKQYLGKPYIYGSTNLNVGTDCSGFTYAVFKNFGINLNRVSKDQYLNGVAVDKNNLQPADLVFFNTGGDSPISHVGIYIGNDQYIHSTDSNNNGIMISSLNSDYALKTYYGARRVI